MSGSATTPATQTMLARALLASVGDDAGDDVGPWPALGRPLAAGGADRASADVTRPEAVQRDAKSASEPAHAHRHPIAPARPAKRSTLDDPVLVQAYHLACTAIFECHDRAAAIGQFKAPGHDDDANMASLIGYSARAPKDGPNRVLGWNPQIERADRERADHRSPDRGKLRPIAPNAGHRWRR